MSADVLDGRMLDHEWFGRPLPANVEIAESAWLWSSYAFLHYRSRRPVGVRIGSDSGLYAGTMFDLDEHGEVRIGRYCTLVAPVFCTNGIVDIGDHVLMSSRVTVADWAVAVPGRSGRDTDAPSAQDGPLISVGSGAWIGTGAVLLAGAHVGADSIVGAGSVVDGPVPAGSVAAGHPYRVVRRPT